MVGEVPCGEQGDGATDPGVEGGWRNVGSVKGAEGSGCFRGRPRGFFNTVGGRRLAIGGEGDRFSTSCVTGTMEFDVGEVGDSVGDGDKGESELEERARVGGNVSAPARV